jgi:DNA adenine methylase
MHPRNPSIAPIIKWPGGKSGELNVILPEMPNSFDRYFEPFLGGGAVLLSIPHNIPAFANDISKDLINLYRLVSISDPEFLQLLDGFSQIWTGLQLISEHHTDRLLSTYNQFSEYTLTEIDVRDILYKFVKQNHDMFAELVAPHITYDVEHFINETKKSITSKVRRMRKLEAKKGRLPTDDVMSNIEGAFKSAFYTHIRHLYNQAKEYGISNSDHSAIFFFMRENAYGSMFRFNRDGKFNIPYGGISYNRKDVYTKIHRMKDPNLIARFKTTKFENMDFEKFIANNPPQSNDFIFLDPPYDTEFSDYDQSKFGQQDQERLADFLLHDCTAQFMLVIKCTDFIKSLYQDKGIIIKEINKKYMYTVKERNNRDAVHLMIKNY